MKFPSSMFVCAAIFALVLLSGCEAGDSGAAANKMTAKGGAAQNAGEKKQPADDVEELGRKINLPFAPTEATWIDFAPQEKKLIAVLKFSATDAEQIVSSAAKEKSATPTEIDAENWFPAELVARTPLSGDGTLKGIALAPRDFIKSPFTSGKLTRIAETDYFVLELIS